MTGADRCAPCFNAGECQPPRDRRAMAKRLIWVNALTLSTVDQAGMRYQSPFGFGRGVGAMLAVGMLAAGAPLAAAQPDDIGDPIAGRQIANAWCANCHALPDSKVVTATGAPSFPAIAADRAITPLALRAFLRTPHARMPDLHLSNGETDDLIAFVLATRVR